MLPVADMTAVVAKLLKRLEAIGAPPSITVTLGWDGARIMANMGDYNKLVKSLPTQRITVERGDSEEQAGAAIRVAVARLRVALQGKVGKSMRRKSPRSHAFRQQARADIARGKTGD